MNEEEVLVGRIQDLAEQCYHRDVPSHTEFLTLAEQDLFYRTVNKIPGVRYVLSGGYEAAERKAARSSTSCPKARQATPSWTRSPGTRKPRTR